MLEPRSEGSERGALTQEEGRYRWARLGCAGRLARRALPAGHFPRRRGLERPVPFRPRASAKPTSVMPQTEEAQFYQLYFQAPGVAEAEFERDPRATIRRMLGSVSFAAPRG